MKNILRTLQFTARDRWFGNLKLRQDLPKLPDEKEEGAERSSKTKTGEHRYYELLLSELISSEIASTIGTVVDVGCRNGSYLEILAEFFSSASITGVELDGGRRYWNLYRRRDVAEAYAERLRRQGRDVQLIFRDFCDVQQIPLLSSMDRRRSRAMGLSDPNDNVESLIFCFFFPFVSNEPCIQWGLPTRFASFEKLLRHAFALADQSSNRQGTAAYCLSVHQGEWEAELARSAYQSVGLKPKEAVLSPTLWEGFWPSRYPSWVFLSSLIV